MTIYLYFRTIFSVLLVLGVVFCQSIVVSPDGDDASVSGPFKTLDKALQQMGQSSTGLYISVKPGVYPVTTTRNDRIYFEAQQSIYVFAENPAAETVFECSPDGEANVVFVFGGALISLSGLEFRNCKHYGDYDNSGAAVSIANSMNIIIDNCTFTNNFANYSAGALEINSVGFANITNSRFYNNSALNAGGAIRADLSDISITNSYFYGNKAGGYGGAIYLIPAYDNFTPRHYLFSHVTMNYNSAYDGGGAMYIEGGNNYVTAIVEDSTFIGNVVTSNSTFASSGGALNIQINFFEFSFFP